MRWESDYPVRTLSGYMLSRSGVHWTVSTLRRKVAGFRWRCGTGRISRHTHGLSFSSRQRTCDGRTGGAIFRRKFARRALNWQIGAGKRVFVILLKRRLQAEKRTCLLSD